MYHSQPMSLGSFPSLCNFHFNTTNNVKRTAVRTSAIAAERARPACVLQCVLGEVMTVQMRFQSCVDMSSLAEYEITTAAAAAPTTWYPRRISV
jgi:hypothetical protein